MKLINGKWKQQTGLSLIELMISVVISLFLIGGVMQMYISNKDSYRTTAAMARLQEDARYVNSVLGKEIRMANHAGCKSFPDDITNISNIVNNVDTVVGSGNKELWNVGVYNFAGYVAGSGPTALLPADVDPDSDIIGIRRMSVNSTSLTNPLGVGNTTIDVDSVAGMQVGKIYIINDCALNVGVFQVQKITAAGATIHLESSGNFAATVPGNDVAGMDLGFPEGSEVGELEVVLLYVRYLDSDGDSVKDTRELARTILTYNADGLPVSSGTQSLVRGVDSLRFVYGSDTDADDVADSFKAANNVADWTHVVVVKATYTTSSDEKLGGGNYNASTTADSGNLWGALSGIDDVSDLNGKVIRRFSTLVHIRNTPKDISL